MDESFRKDFWAIICGFRQPLRVLFILVTILLILSLIALVGVERGSTSFGVVILDLVVLVPFWLVVGWILRKC